MELEQLAYKRNWSEIWVLEFTAESAQEFRERIMTESKENPNKPIIIYVDSYGGQVDALAKMISTMDEIPNPIVTCCIGKAMSCGAILLSHGDLRFCDPHSRIMIHKVSSAIGGDSEDLTNDATEVARLNEYWMGLMAANCHIKGGYRGLEKIMKSKDGRDRYLTAKEAQEIGIIDIVGKPRLASMVMHEIVDSPEKISISKRASLRAQHRKEILKKEPEVWKTKVKSKRKKNAK